MIHALKKKKKNINRELGKLYDKKRKLLENITLLEEAKLNIKIRLDALKRQRKGKKAKK